MNTGNIQDQPEKRKGFHPTLVIATVAVVIFVLWFCPKALMGARISQTESRAAAILRDRDIVTQAPEAGNGGIIRLTPQSDYTDYTFITTTDSPEAIYALPRYYGRTAINTFCLLDGEVYRKDIPNITPESPLPVIDSGWQK